MKHLESGDEPEILGDVGDFLSDLFQSFSGEGLDIDAIDREFAVLYVGDPEELAFVLVVLEFDLGTDFVEFFRDVLQVDEDQAEIDACKIEHLLSITTSMKLATFMKLIKSGDKTSKNFLQKLKQQDEICTHDVTNCDHCDTVCLINPELNNT